MLNPGQSDSYGSVCTGLRVVTAVKSLLPLKMEPSIEKNISTPALTAILLAALVLRLIGATLTHAFTLRGALITVTEPMTVPVHSGV